MSYLEVLPNITTLDVINISKKIECSERQVWRALRRLRDISQEASEKYEIMTEISSDLKYLVSVLINLSQNPRKLTADETRKLNKIGQDIIEIDKKIVEIKERYGT